MTNLIEVVFERVAKSCVKDLLELLLYNSGKIRDVQCGENIKLFFDDRLSEEALNNFLDFDGSIIILINMHTMAIGKYVLPNVQLRLLKYESEYDIEFNFDYNELKNISMSTLINNLYSHIKEITSDFKIARYYAGMEPASDEDTRYFTNEELGPLIT